MIELLAASATAPDIAVFAVGALLVVVGAFGVVLSRNPVHAALSLVTTLFGIAVLFVQQEAHFLAAVQVIVYAGAIVVLFLFVIMLLGVDRIEAVTKDRLKSLRPFAVLLALGVVGLVVALANWSWEATGQRSAGGVASGSGSNVETLANSIFTQYLLPFEATSLLLVIAVVGAVVLARRVEVTRSFGDADFEDDDDDDDIDAEGDEVEGEVLDGETVVSGEPAGSEPKGGAR